jgi:hypothetical protein
MTTDTIPTAKTLEALGTEYLAEMLVQICTGDAELARRLVVLATTAAPRLAAREIRRRLDFIGRSRTYIYSDRRDAFIAEIDNQRRAIRELARHDPGEALDLLWELTALADSVILRCDNSDDTVLDAFRAAGHDLAAIAAESKPDRARLADRTFQAICANSFGQYADLIIMLAPALENEGLERLKARVKEMAEESVPIPPDDERTVITYGPAGPVHEDDLLRFDHELLVLRTLEDIADAQGDVDAYIALQGEANRTVPEVAAEIARRLLAAGRIREAWEAINRSIDRNDRPREGWPKTRAEAIEWVGFSKDAAALC